MQPWLRAQSSATAKSCRPIPRCLWLSATYQPSTYPTGRTGSQPSAWERKSTSRKPTKFPSLASATKMMSGSVTGALPARIAVTSRACSSAEAVGHNASRMRTSWSRSDG